MRRNLRMRFSEEVLDILRHGKLMLSRPGSFDDPFEMQPAVVPRFSDERKQRDYAVGQLKKIMKEQRVGPSVRRDFVENRENSRFSLRTPSIRLSRPFHAQGTRSRDLLFCRQQHRPRNVVAVRGQASRDLYPFQWREAADVQRPYSGINERTRPFRRPSIAQILSR